MGDQFHSNRTVRKVLKKKKMPNHGEVTVQWNVSE